MKNLFPIVEKSIIVENPATVENCWQFPQNPKFSESYQEFYSPDVWFIGKQRTFEKAISKVIQKADNMVIISSFLLQYTEIIKATLAVSSKARVYVITASENRLNSANRFEEGLKEEKIKDLYSKSYPPFPVSIFLKTPMTRLSILEKQKICAIA